MYFKFHCSQEFWAEHIFISKGINFTSNSEIIKYYEIVNCIILYYIEALTKTYLLHKKFRWNQKNLVSEEIRNELVFFHGSLRFVSTALSSENCSTFLFETASAFLIETVSAFLFESCSVFVFVSRLMMDSARLLKTKQITKWQQWAS